MGLVHPRVVELPEVDPAARLLIGIAPQPELDLECRDALALEFSTELRLLDRRPRPVEWRHPAVAIADEHDQERPAALHVIEADLQHQFLLGVVVGEPPRLDAHPQVNPLQDRVVLCQFFPERVKRPRLQQVPFLVHVAERPAHEHRPRAPAHWSLLEVRTARSIYTELAQCGSAQPCVVSLDRQSAVEMHIWNVVP